MFREIYDRLTALRCDAVGHLLIGYAIVLSLTMLTLPLLISLLVVVGAGWGKEKFDARHPQTHTSDPVDFAITVLGGAIGALFVLFTQVIL
jgi:hypothetical protein